MLQQIVYNDASDRYSKIIDNHCTKELFQVNDAIFLFGDPLLFKKI